MAVDENEINASSTLSSADGKYSADNLASGREHAWAEGVEGSGIGESIRIISSCGYNDDHTAGTVIFLEGDIEPDIYDGYMRYTQICIVNGYAKKRKNLEGKRSCQATADVCGRPPLCLSGTGGHYQSPICELPIV